MTACYTGAEVAAAVALALVPGATWATYATAYIRGRLGLSRSDVRAADAEQEETAE